MVRSGNPLGMSSMAMSAEAVVADKVGRCREKICKKNNITNRTQFQDHIAPH